MKGPVVIVLVMMVLMMDEKMKERKIKKIEIGGEGLNKYLDLRKVCSFLLTFTKVPTYLPMRILRLQARFILSEVSKSTKVKSKANE